MIPNLPRAPGPVADRAIGAGPEGSPLKAPNSRVFFGFLRCLPEVRAGLT